MLKYDRIIHTKLYSQAAYDMLCSVIGEWSDGLYETSPRVKKYWHFVDIQRATDNEVLICLSTVKYILPLDKVIYNNFTNMDDSEIMPFFAKYVKAITYADIRDNNLPQGWKRDSTDEMTYLVNSFTTANNLTVGHAYALYDYLLGRKSRTNLDIISTPNIKAVA